jgi:hypothetical protein
VSFFVSIGGYTAADYLKYASGNSASTTLSSGVSNSDTSASLIADTNFNAKSGEGMVVMSEGENVEEYAYATGKSGGALTIPLANRGLEGGSAQTHPSQATVKGIITAGMWNNVIDALSNVVSKVTGALDTTKVVTPTATQTLTNKTLTAPIIDVITNTENRANKLTRSVINDEATITLDLSLGNIFEFILGGNRILAFSNIPTIDATRIRYIGVRPIQDSTGSRTVTWPNTAVATITVTIATPGVVTLGKDIPTCTPITFTTTGALPTGVSAGTTYYWIRNDATTGWLATSIANAQAGTKVATSGTQSGVHSAQIQIRWSGGAAPTLSTGAYMRDSIVLAILDSTNGIIEGYVAGQGA